MRKIYAVLLALVVACTFSFARTFDGTEKIYLKANAVTWWIDANAAQRAVLDNAISVIGAVEDADRFIYAFTIPAGEFSTIRFERAESAEAAAWNTTGDITIPAEGDYVIAFEQNSAEATWETYAPAAPVVYTTHHITVTNNTGWEGFYVYAWGSSEAFGTWPGSDQTSLDFQAADGEVTLHLIFHQDDGDANRQLFDITEARDYNLVVTAEGVVEEGQELPTFNTYHLYVNNQTGWDVFDLYAWGTPNEPFGTWPGITEPATLTVDGVECNVYDFKVAEGGTVELNLIFHNNVGEGEEGDMRVLYTLTEARDYMLTITATEAVEGDVPAGIEEVVLRGDQTRKMIYKGQIVVVKDGRMYNLLGGLEK